MWYTKGALISLSLGFVKYQSPYDLLGPFILTYSIKFVYAVFIIVVINHNDRLSHLGITANKREMYCFCSASPFIIFVN